MIRDALRTLSLVLAIRAVLVLASAPGPIVTYRVDEGALVILDVDWDVVLSIVLGLAGIGYVVIDHRRVSKLDEWGQSLGERQSATETRVTQLEAMLVGQGQQTIPERIAALEAQPDLVEDVAAIRERVATIEARIDFKQITHTRNAKGKFTSPDAAATCTDEERRR